MKTRVQTIICNEKKPQTLASLDDKKRVSFEFKEIGCFITSSSKTANHVHKKSNKQSVEMVAKIVLNKEALKNKEEKKASFSQIKVPRKNKGMVTSKNNQAFNNSLLLLQYQNSDENKFDTCVDAQKQDSPQNDHANVNDVVNSCVKVITQETQNSSNPITARYNQISPSIDYNFSQRLIAEMFMQFTPQEYCSMPKRSARHREQVSIEQSKAFIIDLKKIESDTKTSIMIRNIPNKYTQDDLLQLFEKNHKKKFDFFYLPVDYRVKDPITQTHCNVGYAFINFIHTKFITDFYLEFHLTKWNKFNSSKVCNVCYARIQGTAQLENHFLNSKVIQQKDRRFRPLIGLKTLTQNIQNLVQKQKCQEQDEDNNMYEY